MRHPVVDSNPGSYYLGSTAPDMRFLIGASREETHYLSLSCEEGASGVESMLEANPELVQDKNIGAATKAFVAGYLSHLVTDEVWVYRIYRPFFGKASALGGSPTANLLDRLLQFELDRRERLDGESIPVARTEMNKLDSQVTVGFIDDPTLNRWREFVYIATSGELNWDDFRRFAEKYLIWMRYVPNEKIDAFFESFEDRLKQVQALVPEERIREFREQSIADSVRVAREYLG